MLISAQLAVVASDGDMRVFLLILLLIAIALIIIGCAIAVLILHRAQKDRLLNGKQSERRDQITLFVTYNAFDIAFNVAFCKSVPLIVQFLTMIETVFEFC